MADDSRTNASAPVTETVEHPISRMTEPTGSVLICDDRPATGRELSQTFRRFLPSIVPVNAHLVDNGFALVDAFQTMPADLVLIGIHAGSTAGIDAINLLMGLHPEAKAVVYGSVTDVELLASAYAQGADGLLVWEPTGIGQPTEQNRAAPGCAGLNLRAAHSHRR